MPNVAERGKGSGLILRPEVAAELIDAAKACGLPVSVKTRIGFTEMAEMEAWITHLLEQDIANLSIHFANTKRDEQSGCSLGGHSANYVYSGPCRTAKRQLRLMGIFPIVKKGLELAEQYGVDGIMIGRGFLKILMPLKKNPKTHTPQELLGLLRLQLICKTNMQNWCLVPSLGRIASFKIYVKGFPGAADLRAQLMNTKSTDEVRQLLATFEAEHGVLD